MPTQAGGPSASAAFEKPFLDATAANYGAPLEPRDFKNAPAQQRAFINGWVKKQTRDRIVDLIPPPGIDAETRLVLVNALYLKAAWAALEKKLNASTLASWLGKMKHERVWLTLPKFTIDPAKTIDLADTLKAMGMPLAFTAAKADFTGISNPPNPNRRLCRVCLLNIRRC